MKLDEGLLDRYKNGKCSKEELEMLRRYFQQGDFTELDNILKAEWDGIIDDTIQDNETVKAEVWEKLVAKQPKLEGKVIRLNSRLTKFASVAAVLGLLIVTAWFWTTSRFDKHILAEYSNQSNAPQQMQLGDGSLVSLAPGSRLSYPKRLEGTTRMVVLEGEAHFEVKTDSLRPFIVQTGAIQTRVLGTTFNIEAFPKRNTIEVALLEGSVAVDIQQGKALYKAATLSPGEAFTFEKESGEYSTKKLASLGVYEWPEGRIRFQRASVYEVVETLENWYDISIEFQNNTSTYESLVHRIDTRKMNLDEVLEGISLVANYRFEKTGKNEYLITLK